jgi:hypothetical protein
MTSKLLLLGSLGVLFYFGFILVRDSFTRVEELEQDAVPQPAPQEEILRTFFRDELAQKMIAHLALYDLQSFEVVMEPRPRLSEIVERFGEADSVAEEDLSAFGVSQRGRVHFYGRLGLVTLVGRPDQEIFWILIAERATNSLARP